jgi:hypothetical protein
MRALAALPAALLAALLAVVVAGCGSAGSGQHATASRAPTSNTAPTSSARPARSSAAATSPDSTATSRAAAATGVPSFAHVVVVVEENHAASQLSGNPAAPYINGLARTGVDLTDYQAITHPSEPNYLALFSGSTHGLTDDSCPHSYSSANLGSQLRSAGLSFVGYSESLPSAGYLGCSAAPYARKHAPWTDFPALPASTNQPFAAFPTDFARLPRLAFVVPNLDDDMHDGTIGQADTWLKTHLGGYVDWARTHDSLLVLTWDEDDDRVGNHIPGVLAGAHLVTGAYRRHVDHYTMLRTIEAAFGLPGIGAAASRSPITSVWSA